MITEFPLTELTSSLTIRLLSQPFTKSIALVNHPKVASKTVIFGGTSYHHVICQKSSSFCIIQYLFFSRKKKLLCLSPQNHLSHNLEPHYSVPNPKMICSRKSITVPDYFLISKLLTSMVMILINQNYMPLTSNKSTILPITPTEKGLKINA